MITGALELLAGLWAFVGRLLKAVGLWLRTPHNWWRIGCFLFAIAFAVSALIAGQARRTVLVVQQECLVKVQSAQVQVQAATQAATTNQATARQCAVTLKREVGTRQAVEQKATQAVKAAQRREAQAEKDLAAWQVKYNRRPRSCDEALAEMEAQCTVVPDS